MGRRAVIGSYRLAEEGTAAITGCTQVIAGCSREGGEMSWEATGWAKKTRGHASAGQKLVLLILSEYHNTEKGMAWPSQRTLAADCEIPVRTIQHHLRTLETVGFITTLQKGNQYQPSQYRLNFACTQAHEPAKSGPAMVAPTPEPAISDIVNPQYGASEPATPRITSLQEPILEPIVLIKRDWPEWFSLGQELKGWTVQPGIAEAWRVKSGFSESFCLDKIYVLRGWWTKKHEKDGRDPYATFQRACRENWGGSKNGVTQGHTSADNPENTRAKREERLAYMRGESPSVS